MNLPWTRLIQSLHNGPRVPTSIRFSSRWRTEAPYGLGILWLEDLSLGSGWLENLLIAGWGRNGVFL